MNYSQLHLSLPFHSNYRKLYVVDAWIAKYDQSAPTDQWRLHIFYKQEDKHGIMWTLVKDVIDVARYAVKTPLDQFKER